MTRLPTLLTSIVVLAVCIGLNVHRYPVVWESMRAASPSLNVPVPSESTSQEVTAASQMGSAATPTPERTTIPSEIPSEPAHDASQNAVVSDDDSQITVEKEVTPVANSPPKANVDATSEDSHVSDTPENAGTGPPVDGPDADSSDQEAKTEEMVPVDSVPDTEQMDTETNPEDQGEESAKNSVGESTEVAKNAVTPPPKPDVVAVDRPVELVALDGEDAATASRAKEYEKHEVVLTSQKRSLVSRPSAVAQSGWVVRERPFSREEIRDWLRQGSHSSSDHQEQSR